MKRRVSALGTGDKNASLRVQDPRQFSLKRHAARMYITPGSPSHDIITKLVAKLVWEDFHNKATRDCFMAETNPTKQTHDQKMKKHMGKQPMGVITHK